METVAPVVLVRSRSSRMSTTPVVPFFTTMLPSLQVPVTTYVPDSVIFTWLFRSDMTYVMAFSMSATRVAAELVTVPVAISPAASVVPAMVLAASVGCAGG